MMKTQFKRMGLIALASALIFPSCLREESSAPAVPEEEGMVDIVFSPTLEDQPETRTSMSLNGDNAVFSWNQGDKLTLRQIYYWNDQDDPVIKTATTQSLNPNSQGEVVFRATFPYVSSTTSLSPYPGHEEKCFMYQGFYPQSRVTFSTNSDDARRGFVQITLPARQSPGSSSFDPKADILYSKPLYVYRQRTTNSQNENYQKTELDKFNRLNAIGIMTLKGLPANKNVSYVKFISFARETPLAGTVTTRTKTDEFHKDNLVYYDLKDTLKLNYGNSMSTSNKGEFTAYFTCLPGKFVSGRQFRVKIGFENETTEVKKTFQVPSGKELKFASGKATKFSVNMAGVGPVVHVDEVTDSVTMMSYNVYTFERLKLKQQEHPEMNIQNRDIYSDIAAVIRASGATLVGLNEVDRATSNHPENQAKKLAQTTRTNGNYWDSRFFTAISRPVGAYGNAILYNKSVYPEITDDSRFSRLELPNTKENSSTVITYPKLNSNGEVDVWKKEEVRCVGILETDKCVFATVHLGLSDEGRERQVKVLNKYFREHFLNYEKPVFLCGDFNADPWITDVICANPVDELMGSDWVRITQDTTKSHPSGNVLTDKRLDHFFVYRNTTVKDVEVVSEMTPKQLNQLGISGWGYQQMTFLSDHRPVIVSVKWRKAAAVKPNNNYEAGVTPGASTAIIDAGSF